MNSMVGSGDDADVGFVRVESSRYPGLADHYAAQVRTWVMKGA